MMLNVLMADRVTKVRVEGARVTIPGLEEFEFYAHNTVDDASTARATIHDDVFSVCEYRSGAGVVVSVEGTPEDAAQAARDRLQQIGLERARRVLRTAQRNFKCTE